MQEAIPDVPAVSVQDPGPLNSPLASELKLMVPVGVVGLASVSVTVAMQFEASLTTTDPEIQDTLVVVE